MIRFLAISGSLRRRSFNTALLQAACELAPESMEISLYADLGKLPLFNPDLEGNEPAAVRALWRQVDAADGLLIASPEYAHGVTGAMKNCLDWLVSGHEFVNKPVAVFNCAPRAHHALDALKETIRTMNGALIEAACMEIPLAGGIPDDALIREDPRLAAPLREALDMFAQAVRTKRARAG